MSEPFPLLVRLQNFIWYHTMTAEDLGMISEVFAALSNTERAAKLTVDPAPDLANRLLAVEDSLARKQELDRSAAYQLNIRLDCLSRAVEALKNDAVAAQARVEPAAELAWRVLSPPAVKTRRVYAKVAIDVSAGSDADAIEAGTNRLSSIPGVTVTGGVYPHRDGRSYARFKP